MMQLSDSFAAEIGRDDQVLCRLEDRLLMPAGKVGSELRTVISLLDGRLDWTNCEPMIAQFSEQTLSSMAPFIATEQLQSVNALQEAALSALSECFDVQSDVECLSVDPLFPFDTLSSTPVPTILVVADFVAPEFVDAVQMLRSQGRPVVLTRLRKDPLIGPLVAEGGICAECVQQVAFGNDLCGSLIRHRFGRSLPLTRRPSEESLTSWLEAFRRLSRVSFAPLFECEALVVRVGNDATTSFRVTPTAACQVCTISLPNPAQSIDPELGIVRSLEEIAEKHFLHVKVKHALEVNNALRAKSPEEVCYWLDSSSEGKGLIAGDAVEGALGETVERICSIFSTQLDFVAGPPERLEHDYVPRSAFMHYSRLQYEYRDIENPRRSHYNRVPPPENDDPGRWVLAHALRDGLPVYVPAEAAYLDVALVLGEDPATKALVSSSNGCAAASSIDTAISRASLEVVERDAVAIWWYNRLVRPPVNRAEWGAAAFHAEELLRERVRRLEFLDLTHDVGVPVVVALAPLVQPNGAASETLIGSAARFTYAEACDAAAMEALQFLTMLDGLQQGPERFNLNMSDSRAWWTLNFEDHAWLQPSMNVLRVEPEIRSSDQLRARLAAMDHQACWVDQTQARLGMHSVRVMVPSFRHFWRRLAAGRLYDVPVDLGWLGEANEEQNLNPLSVFY